MCQYVWYLIPLQSKYRHWCRFVWYLFDIFLIIWHLFIVCYLGEANVGVGADFKKLRKDISCLAMAVHLVIGIAYKYFSQYLFNICWISCSKWLSANILSLFVQYFVNICSIFVGYICSWELSANICSIFVEHLSIFVHKNYLKIVEIGNWNLTL